MTTPAPSSAFATLACALALGCAATGAVRVGPLGPAAPPRGPGCSLEFLEKAPERPHERLAELTATAPSVDGQAALSVLRDPACQLGADALLVTHRTTPRGPTSMVSAVAIRWLPAPPPAPEPAPAEPPPGREPPRPPPGGVDL